MRIAATPVGVLTRRIAAEERRRLGAAPKFSAAVLRPNAPAILAATEGYASEARLLAVLGDQGGLAGAGGGSERHERPLRLARAGRAVVDAVTTYEASAFVPRRAATTVAA